MSRVQQARQKVTNRLQAMGAEPQHEWARAFRKERRELHPPFVRAVVADAQLAARLRGERWETSGKAGAAFQVLRLSVVTDSFFAQACYRAKADLQRRGVPIVPRLFHRLAMVTGQVCIGDPAVLAPGVYIPHGQVVVDARSTIGPGVTLSPFTTIGRIAGKTGGPTLAPMVTVGTGAKVLGPVTVGKRSTIGANAVVVEDVPDDSVAIGVPAQVRPKSSKSKA